LGNKVLKNTTALSTTYMRWMEFINSKIREGEGIGFGIYFVPFIT